MGFLDRLLGREPRDDRNTPYRAPGAGGRYQPQDAPAYGTPGPAFGSAGHSGRSEDEVAVERYKYLLRTAPPDAVEQAHAEAFAQLTPEQRRQVLTQLSNDLPPSERATSDDPRSLARMATRAELRRPGTLVQNFGGGGGYGGPGVGAMLGSSLLGTIAGVVIGSAIADAMFGSEFGDPSQDFAGDSGEVDPGAGAEADTGADAGAEADAGGDFGGDFGGGDFGGDFGGGDF